MSFVKPKIPRGQITLWAERLDDALGDDHTVRLFNDLCDSESFRSALTALDAAQEQKEGRPSYAPSVLAKLYLYGQLIRVRSSRRLEQACLHRIDVIWLMEGLKPDHATIARLVTRHGKSLRGLLKATIQLAKESGLLTLEMVAIDGTFVEANASRKSVRKKREIEERLQEMDERVDQMMEEFQRNDEAEGRAAEAEMLVTSDGTMSEAQRRVAFERKRQRLQSALAAIERRQSQPRRADQPPPKAIASVTDPDARHLRDKEGRRKPNFNVQIGVDGKAGIAVAASVNDEPNDAGQMMPVLEEIKANCGQMPQEAVVDAGYHSGRQVSRAMSLEKSDQVKVFMSDPDFRRYKKADEARTILKTGGRLSLEQLQQLPRDDRKLFHRACFVYDEATDTYRCPAGEVLTKQRKRTSSDRFGPIEGAEYGTAACEGCELASQCHRSKTGKRLSHTEFEPDRQAMLERTKGDDGKERALRRASTVEPRIGDLKTKHDLRRFLRRGLANVTAELLLAVAGMNIKTLINNWPTVADSRTVP